MKVVVLLSGGLDSTVLLGKCLSDGHEVQAVSVNYGQRHSVELEAAMQVANRYNVKHEILDLAPSLLRGASALTGDTPVPRGHYEDESMKATVVPARNTLLLSMAASAAVRMGMDAVAYAAHAGDHAIYSDCRPEFVDAMRSLLLLADHRPIQLLTPFVTNTKTDIVGFGHALQVPFDVTWSCYDPQPCRGWKPNTKDLSLDWVVGFVEGEGCFTHMRQTPKSNSKLRECKVYPSFSVSQKDRPILDQLKAFFGFGSVCLHRGKYPTHLFSVGGHKRCSLVASVVNNRLRVPYKREQFYSWCRRFQLLRKTVVHCGGCGTCVERREAFSQAGITDPTEYAT